MKNIVTLDNIDVGGVCIVYDILFEGNKRSRIFDLGIIPNTRIEVLYKSPFKNPTAYYIRGTTLALRNEDAKKISDLMLYLHKLIFLFVYLSMM